MRKFLKICLAIIFVLLILLPSCGLDKFAFEMYYLMTPTPTRDSLNRNLNKNYDENMDFIDYVRNIGETENFESIWFSKNYDGVWCMLVHDNVHGYESTKIQDIDFVNMIESLCIDCNYSRISYTTKYIYFQNEYGTTRDSAYGIVYSFDGNIPNFEYVVEIEPLEKQNWYYYYSDYNLYEG